MEEHTSFLDALRAKYCDDDATTESFVQITVYGGGSSSSRRPPRPGGVNAAEDGRRSRASHGDDESVPELGYLKNVVLYNSNISHAAIPPVGLYSLCPNVHDLDLSNNTLSSWNEVLTILRHLPRLKFVNLSSNPLGNCELARTEDIPCVIEDLVLNDTKVSWSDVAALSRLMPTLKQLHLCKNDYSAINVFDKDVADNLCHLRLLALNNNQIKRWDEVAKLKSLPQLHTLVLLENPLEDVYYKQTHPSYESADPESADSDPANPEPVDPEPADPEPADPDPADPEPVDPEPVDPDPADPDDQEPADPEPADPEPADLESADPDPANPEPVDPEPADLESANPDPADPEPVDPEPADPEPADPEPADPHPADPEPADLESADPDPANPEPADPEPADPEPADLESADPEPADPEPADLESADPEPADPEPADPEPADPEPADPEPADPEPADPDPADLEPADPAFPALESLCVTGTRLSDWQHLHELRHFPKLRSVKIKNIPLLESWDEAERRKVAVACLPGIKLLNGSEITPEEREKAERHFVRVFVDHEKPPSRLEELVQKHGMLKPLHHVDLSRGFKEFMELRFIHGGRCIHRGQVRVVESVGKLKEFCGKLLNTSPRMVKLYHLTQDPDTHEPVVDEMFLDSLPMSRFDLKDGDEILIDLKTLSRSQRNCCWTPGIKLDP